MNIIENINNTIVPEMDWDGSFPEKKEARQLFLFTKIMNNRVILYSVTAYFHQNRKFLVLSLILSRISPLSFERSKSLRLCVVKF